MKVEYDPGYFLDPDAVILSQPTGQLTYLSITVNGTPVPEPSGLLALGGLAASAAGTLRIRRRAR